MRRSSWWSLRHPLSLLGASIASVTGSLILLLLFIELLGYEVNPYRGLLAFLAFPALLVAGLLLIPLGTWLSTRRGDRPFPVLDINLPSHRARLLAFLALTAVNIVLLSAAGYRGVESMDSPQFCGQVCHKVMHPQYTAWQSSVHARVACVSCHVGPGASGVLRAKMNGVHQLLDVITGSYDRPIPAPVQSLRPARETCERCHWRQVQHGDLLKVKTSFLDDEASTAQKSVLMLKVGGAQGDAGSGIHWHMNIANRITYVPTDATRQTIPWVQLTDREGKVTEFLAPGGKPPSEEEMTTLGREMDCVDCHNRPAHQFLPAHAAVDEAMASGQLTHDLPFTRKVVLEAVSADYESGEAAAAGIEEHVRRYYAENHPDVARARADDVARTASTAAAIYSRNVFPEMGIAWGTYPSMSGHTDTNGCFRCHDGEHASAAGETITNDCDACHTVLAMEETDPEILRNLAP